MKVFVALMFLLACAGPAFAEAGSTSQDQQSRIKAMDTDNDGQVSSQEFQGPREQFSQMDRNHDGKLDQNEQQRLAQSGSSDRYRQQRGRMSEQDTQRGRMSETPGEQHSPSGRSSTQTDQGQMNR